LPEGEGLEMLRTTLGLTESLEIGYCCRRGRSLLAQPAACEG